MIFKYVAVSMLVGWAIGGVAAWVARGQYDEEQTEAAAPAKDVMTFSIEASNDGITWFAGSDLGMRFFRSCMVGHDGNRCCSDAVDKKFTEVDR